MDGIGNAIGGFTFQFSDDWWKVGQTTNLNVHDTDATWNSGGYYPDDDRGKNNMNEEWFGICAKVRTNAQGSYELLPRAAYFVLKAAHSFEVYDESTTVTNMTEHFDQIDLNKAISDANAYAQKLTGLKNSK